MARYDGPIVDAHQHFWEPDRNPHPWLKPGVRIPFRYGNYDAIKRRYLPDDYRRDAAPYDVEQTVYIETEWEPTDPIGETRYASTLPERFGLPNAIVAQAWLDREDVAAVLAGQAAFPLVRSVRHKPGGPTSPGEVGRSRSLMSDPAWRRGFDLLQRHGLRFDLQTPWWNLDECVWAIRETPHGSLPGSEARLVPLCRKPGMVEDDQRIGEVDARGPHRDAHLALGQGLGRQLHQLQAFRSTGSLAHHRPHVGSIPKCRCFVLWRH